jgi:hypothetical protein
VTNVFFLKLLILVSIDMPKTDFEFYQILVKLFVLKLYIKTIMMRRVATFRIKQNGEDGRSAINNSREYIKIANISSNLKPN